MAANYLTVGQIFLQENPAAPRAAAPEHIKPRLLGHWGTSPGPEPDLRASESGDRRARREHHLSRRARPRRTGARRERLSRGHVQRDLSGHHARRRRHATSVSTVLDARRNSEPRQRPDAGIDSRRWRAGLRALARVRCRVRQSRSHRRRRRRRWRGRDGSARGLVEEYELSQSGARRRGAARFFTSTATRSAGRRCWRARRRRRHIAARGARIRRARRRRRRPDQRAPAARRDARSRAIERIRAIQSEARAQWRARTSRAATMAGDRAANTEGMDRTDASSTDIRSKERFARTRFRCRTRRRTRSSWRSSRRGCAATSPKRCSTRAGALVDRSRRARAARRAAHGREPARERRTSCSTARPSRLSRTTPSTCRARQPRVASRRDNSASMLRDVFARNRGASNFRLFCPDETNSNRLSSGVRRRESMSRRPAISRSTITSRRRSRDGSAERTSVRGLARGLSAHRAPRHCS